MSTMLTPTIQATTMGTPIGPLTILAIGGVVRAGGFVDDASPRRIDEDGVVAHPRDGCSVDQISCFRCQWNMKRDDVTFAQERVERPRFD